MTPAQLMQDMTTKNLTIHGLCFLRLSWLHKNKHRNEDMSTTIPIITAPSTHGLFVARLEYDFTVRPEFEFRSTNQTSRSSCVCVCGVLKAITIHQTTRLKVKVDGIFKNHISVTYTQVHICTLVQRQGV
jgi:hypothetical protein